MSAPTWRSAHFQVAAPVVAAEQASAGEPQSLRPVGFFTDSSVCIGCKACEVACKEWNELPSTGGELSGLSFDNTVALNATTWRHVQFIEQTDADGTFRWLFNSDVCKHCADAPCENACPTGSLIRTEFDTVYVQQDICNGCGYCVIACPFGVIEKAAAAPTSGAVEFTRPSFDRGTAHKCTLCYDRLGSGLEPACAKACPTDAILFGDLEQLREFGRRRVDALHRAGEARAQLYGMPEGNALGGLNSFFLLLDEPERYNLPRFPRSPKRAMTRAYTWGLAAALLAAAAMALAYDASA